MSIIRIHAVRAIWRRQLWSLLGNPLGYVFVLAFVLIYGGLLFLPSEFFVRNINDLEPIHNLMPWLLAVLIPAIAMGSWASERELGTEEQMLTLPLSETDALVGKWLAVSTYFTVALACSLSNVLVLAWLGDPDLGLIFSQYFGWWLLGLVYGAVGVMASSWVGLPAVAFVMGSIICGALCALDSSLSWLSTFERGIVSVGQVGVALSAVTLFLGLAVISLSARRWEAARRRILKSAIITLLGIFITLFNFSVQVDRAALDIDITEEGLSSLSAASAQLLTEQKRLVEITAFVSEELPPELSLKGQEVLNFLQLVERAAPDRVKLTLYRPADSLDESATIASNYFGLKPRTVVVDTVTGKEEREVFLAAVVTCGARTEKITHFSAGLSVEYELVRAVRSAATVKKQVIGIARTALNMLGGLDYATRRMTPPWQVIEELKKQYEVRSVNLDVPVAADVTALIVPQPSSLKDPQIVVLHDYIWSGRPTLILEDPMPMFAGPQLGSSQPRPPSQQQMMMGQMGQQQPEPKPDLKPLLSALGLEMPLDHILWSDFNPSHQFRNVWPRNLVWSFRELDGIGDASFLGGINSLLFPWPGELKRASDAPESITVRSLAQPVDRSVWGNHRFDEFMAQSMFGMQMRTPERYVTRSDERPSLAVQITGKMARAYGPESSQEETDQAKDQTENQDEIKSKADAKGALSEHPVNVIFVADIDFAHDEFFAFYRNTDGQFSDDALQFLAELRNVQFISNVVDALSGEEGYLSLRTRRPRPRPLTALVRVLDQAQVAFRQAETAAQNAATAKIDKLRVAFDKRLKAIDSEAGLDENAKAQLRAQVQRAAQRQLDTDIVSVERERDLDIRRANITRKREVESVRGRVRTLALGIPSLLLTFIALSVWTRRRRDELLTIPDARQRGNS